MKKSDDENALKIWATVLMGNKYYFVVPFVIAILLFILFTVLTDDRLYAPFVYFKAG